MHESKLLDRPLPSVLHARFGNPLNPLVLTFISVIVVVPAVFSNLPLPMLLLGVAVMYGVIFLRQGRLINLERQQAKKYSAPLPLKTGKWKSFDTPVQVMVSRNTKRSGGMNVMMTYSDTEVFFDVDLVIDEQTFLTAARTANYQEAITTGQQLAAHFDKPLNDITGEEV